MSCNEPITPLSTSGTGSLRALTCCPSPPAQEQELVRKWKQNRKDLFSTVPAPYGTALFSTGNYEYGINGPPMPGGPSISVFGGTIQPPSSERPRPTNDRIPEVPD
jgi:hypothetical protein